MMGRGPGHAVKDGTTESTIRKSNYMNEDLYLSNKLIDGRPRQLELGPDVLPKANGEILRRPVVIPLMLSSPNDTTSVQLEKNS